MFGALPVSGDHVAEADGGQGDEAEVAGRAQRPVLPVAEDDGAQDQTQRYHDHGDDDRHLHLLVRAATARSTRPTEMVAKGLARCYSDTLTHCYHPSSSAYSLLLKSETRE